MGKHSLLMDVHENDQFVLVDGKTVSNLYDLRNALREMNDETYEHHVNDGRHDFHDWVKDVHDDPKLASHLLKALDQKSAANVLHKQIVALEKGSTVVSPRKSTANKRLHWKYEKMHPGSRYQAAAGIVAALFIVLIISITSKASLTGAVSASVDAAEMQFLGFGVIGAAVFLLGLTLYVIKQKHSH